MTVTPTSGAVNNTALNQALNQLQAEDAAANVGAGNFGSTAAAEFYNLGDPQQLLSKVMVEAQRWAHQAAVQLRDAARNLETSFALDKADKLDQSATVGLSTQIAGFCLNTAGAVASAGLAISSYNSSAAEADASTKAADPATPKAEAAQLNVTAKLDGAAATLKNSIGPALDKVFSAGGGLAIAAGASASKILDAGGARDDAYVAIAKANEGKYDDIVKGTDQSFQNLAAAVKAIEDNETEALKASLMKA